MPHNHVRDALAPMLIWASLMSGLGVWVLVVFRKQVRVPRWRMQSWVCLVFAIIAALMAWTAFGAMFYPGGIKFSGPLMFLSPSVVGIPLFFFSRWFIETCGAKSGTYGRLRNAVVNVAKVVFIGLLTWSACIQAWELIKVATDSGLN